MQPYSARSRYESEVLGGTLGGPPGSRARGMPVGQCDYRHHRRQLGARLHAVEHPLSTSLTMPSPIEFLMLLAEPNPRPTVHRWSPLPPHRPLPETYSNAISYNGGAVTSAHLQKAGHNLSRGKFDGQEDIFSSEARVRHDSPKNSSSRRIAERRRGTSSAYPRRTPLHRKKRIRKLVYTYSDNSTCPCTTRITGVQPPAGSHAERTALSNIYHHT